MSIIILVSYIGVMVKSGEVFPANFPDKGPEQPLRLARLFTGLQPVYLNTYYGVIIYDMHYNLKLFFLLN